jgi:hypothetical protein
METHLLLSYTAHVAYTLFDDGAHSFNAIEIVFPYPGVSLTEDSCCGSGDRHLLLHAVEQ